MHISLINEKRTKIPFKIQSISIIIVDLQKLFIIFYETSQFFNSDSVLIRNYIETLMKRGGYRSNTQDPSPYFQESLQTKIKLSMSQISLEP